MSVDSNFDQQQEILHTLDLKLTRTMASDAIEHQIMTFAQRMVLVLDAAGLGSDQRTALDWLITEAAEQRVQHIRNFFAPLGGGCQEARWTPRKIREYGSYEKL
jgi:hypothetical protein